MMEIVAWGLVAMAVVQIFSGPFVIGKQTTLSAWGYITGIILHFAQIAIAGCVLGWW
jgi:hypothetical protein